MENKLLKFAILLALISNCACAQESIYLRFQNLQANEFPFYTLAFLLNNDTSNRYDNYKEVIKLPFKVKTEVLNYSYVLKDSVIKVKIPITFLYGRNQDNYHIVLDKGNNKTYIDDVFYFGKITNAKASINPIKVDYFIDGLNERISFFIKPLIAGCNYVVEDPEESYWKLCAHLNHFKKATITYLDKKYTFFIKTDAYNDLSFDRKSARIIYQTENENKNFSVSEYNNIPYRVGDVIKLGDDNIRLDSVSNDGNLLTLKLLKNYTQNVGVNINQIAPLFQAPTLVREELVNNNLVRSKDFTLFDFWGTWCKPCLQTIPVLEKGLESINKSRLNIVSVAYENKDVTIDSLLRFVAQHKVSGKIVFEKRGQNNREFLNQVFKIRAYPTFILLDRSGKIIFRKEGSEAAELMIKKLHFVMAEKSS